MPGSALLVSAGPDIAFKERQPVAADGLADHPPAARAALDPYPVDVDRPHIGRRPGHVQEEAAVLPVVAHEHGRQFWVGAPGDTGSGSHPPPVKAVPADR